LTAAFAWFWTHSAVALCALVSTNKVGRVFGSFDAIIMAAYGCVAALATIVGSAGTASEIAFEAGNSVAAAVILPLFDCFSSKVREGAAKVGAPILALYALYVYFGVYGVIPYPLPRAVVLLTRVDTVESQALGGEPQTVVWFEVWRNAFATICLMKLRVCVGMYLKPNRLFFVRKRVKEVPMPREEAELVLLGTELLRARRDNAVKKKAGQLYEETE